MGDGLVYFLEGLVGEEAHHARWRAIEGCDRVDDFLRVVGCNAPTPFRDEDHADEVGSGLRRDAAVG